jgi:hypothetical protein
MARHRQKPRQRTVNTRGKKFRTSKNKFVPPRTLEEFFAMPKKDQEFWGDIGQVTTEVRAGASLRQASRKFGLDPRTIRRLAPSAFRKLRNGRWAAKKSDRLLRVLPIPSREGLIDIGVRDSRQATAIGKYWNAVDLYLRTGDGSSLQAFQGKDIIDADGKRVLLMTDIHELDRLGSAGNLSFESLYARVA